MAEQVVMKIQIIQLKLLKEAYANVSKGGYNSIPMQRRIVKALSLSLSGKDSKQLSAFVSGYIYQEKKGGGLLLM